MDCGCGRSPTGKCIGWHKLSEEEYLEAKKIIIINLKKRKLLKACLKISKLKPNIRLKKKVLLHLTKILYL